MSPLELLSPREFAEAHECLVCGVAEGEPCRDKATGLQRDEPHWSRPAFASMQRWHLSVARPSREWGRPVLFASARQEAAE